MSILAQADITPNTNNLVVSLASAATVNILLCNRSGAVVGVSLAIVPSGTGSPANKHWIEYLLALDPNQPFERDGIPLGAGDQIFVNATAAGISCSVVGLPT
jgi:hypothetical protein